MFNLTDAEKSTILRTMLRWIDPESEEYEALISAIIAFEDARREKERKEQELRETFGAINLIRLNSIERDAEQSAGGTE